MRTKHHNGGESEFFAAELMGTSKNRMNYICCVLTACCLLLCPTEANNGETSGKSACDSCPSVQLPVNVFSTFTFSKETTPYARKITIAAPLVLEFLWGIYLWEWDLGKRNYFAFNPETFIGSHAPNGAADKFGHMYVNYMVTRFLTFMFRATGSTRNAAILQGALINDITSLMGEIGDGFSAKYGFDPYDVLFNHFGILLGMVLEYYPFLDGIFSMRWEYFPSERFKKNIANFQKWDVTTDYDAAKFMLTTKLAGIPHISKTPLRYINIDVGYFSRGYKHPEEHSSRTRNIFIGISLNYSIAFGEALTPGYTSSTLQSLFNYYHPWWDPVVKNWVISNRPHSEF